MTMRDSGVVSLWAEFLVSRATVLAESCSDCSNAALTTSQKVLSNWELVKLTMLDFSDRTRTGISVKKSAAV